MYPYQYDVVNPYVRTSEYDTNDERIFPLFAAAAIPAFLGGAVGGALAIPGPYFGPYPRPFMPYAQGRPIGPYAYVGFGGFGPYGAISPMAPYGVRPPFGYGFY